MASKPPKTFQAKLIISHTAFVRKNLHLGMPNLAGHRDSRDVDGHKLGPVEAPFPRAITPRTVDKSIKTSGMGSLDRMPAELKVDIFNHLDIESFMNARQSCRSAHEFMSGMVEFSQVVENAPSAFRGILQTGMSNYVSFGQIRTVMCTRNCVVCSSRGDLLYLMTLNRVCRRCLRDPWFRTVTLPSFLTNANKTLKEAKDRRLPVVKGTISDDPGLATPTKAKLVHYYSAIKILNNFVNVDVGNGFRNLNAEYTERQMTARRMATVAFPIFNKDEMEVDNVLGCRGCVALYHIVHSSDQHPNLRANAERQYLKDEFLQHFKTCAMARSLLLEKVNRDPRSTQGHYPDLAYVKTGGCRRKTLAPTGFSRSPADMEADMAALQLVRKTYPSLMGHGQ